MPTSTDMLKMQEDAKRRVLEMKNRSRFLVNDMRESLVPPPAPKEKQQDEIVHPAVSESKSPKVIDPERMLLTALCLLLETEGTDKSLLLALMYIMS